jgi:hypothetical protein
VRPTFAKVKVSFTKVKAVVTKVKVGVAKLKVAVTQVEAGATSVRPTITKVEVGSAKVAGRFTKVNVGAAKVAGGRTHLEATFTMIEAACAKIGATRSNIDGVCNLVGPVPSQPMAAFSRWIAVMTEPKDDAHPLRIERNGRVYVLTLVRLRSADPCADCDFANEGTFAGPLDCWLEGGDEHTVCVRVKPPNSNFVYVWKEQRRS